MPILRKVALVMDDAPRGEQAMPARPVIRFRAADFIPLAIAASLVCSGCAFSSGSGCLSARDDRAATSEPAPCGPSFLPVAARRLLPQTFAGADFRPACRCHDRCYERDGKRVCDDRFAADLDDACAGSSNPAACRVVAGVMHGCVVLCGGPSYLLGQARKWARPDSNAVECR